MTYDETLDFLFNRLQSFHNVGATAYKPGLEKAFSLSEIFGNPHKSFRSIHIGGTNGKGSTAHSIASVLMSAGLKVGLYTSPHLVDFRERIKVNGKMIPKKEVIDFVEEFRNMGNDKYDPSFFELTTILAFQYFARQKVDIAVIEVGLGGRLDTTNIIRPELSVITNISFDHTALLGDTLEKIATEKAGIIKSGVPVVIGRRHPETDKVFLKKSDCEIIFAPDNTLFNGISQREDENLFTYHSTPWGDVSSSLTGACQPENMATILNALLLLEKNGVCRLNHDIVDEGLRNVCSQTGLMGRWMKISDSPRVITDTAHNVDGWHNIIEKLKAHNPESLHFLLGFVNDKDFTSILKMLPSEATFYFVQASVQRAVPADTLAEKAKQLGLRGKWYTNVVNGYGDALKHAEGQPDSTVFVGGSTFVVADLLTELNRR